MPTAGPAYNLTIMKAILTRIWDLWKKFARSLARIQTQILLTLFYFLIFVPFGLIMKLFRADPLAIRPKNRSNWRHIESGRFDIDRASHQS